jgi:hypothetical protein
MFGAVLSFLELRLKSGGTGGMAQVVQRLPRLEFKTPVPPPKKLADIEWKLSMNYRAY